MLQGKAAAALPEAEIAKSANCREARREFTPDLLNLSVE